MKTLSKNALKRIVHRNLIDTDGRPHSHNCGVWQAYRAYRQGHRDWHPDAEDFFGVRDSDSPNGRRRVTGHNETMAEFLARGAR